MNKKQMREIVIRDKETCIRLTKKAIALKKEGKIPDMDIDQVAKSFWWGAIMARSFGVITIEESRDWYREILRAQYEMP